MWNNDSFSFQNLRRGPGADLLVWVRTSLGLACRLRSSARLQAPSWNPGLASAGGVAARPGRRSSGGNLHRDLRHKRTRDARAVRSASRIRGLRSVPVRPESHVHRRGRCHPRSRPGSVFPLGRASHAPLPGGHASVRRALRRTDVDHKVRRQLPAVQIIGPPLAHPKAFLKDLKSRLVLPASHTSRVGGSIRLPRPSDSRKGTST